jgi:hypothetical protein
MKQLTYSSLLIVFATLFFLSATSSNDLIINADSQYNPSGTWDYEAQTPDGNLKDVMTITLNAEGVYEVSIKSQIYGALELDDVAFEKMIMTSNVDIEGLSIEFEMKFDGESMEGIVYTGEDELVIKAERRK